MPPKRKRSGALGLTPVKRSKIHSEPSDNDSEVDATPINTRSQSNKYQYNLLNTPSTIERSKRQYGKGSRRNRVVTQTESEVASDSEGHVISRDRAVASLEKKKVETEDEREEASS